ncbi:MAG: transketolase C-terminal domain-containing protein [Sphaerochaetaceae bacterium]|nr:transketolase C-terminal domain-containing protein [Sphaerochaetaceae bacterium]
MPEYKRKSIRASQIEEYISLVEQGVNIIYVVSDSISTSKIAPFMERFPERLVNVGIAEQNLIGVATGLSNGGFIPVTGNATPFLISRSNEQLKVDASYSHTNIKINGLHAGFSYGTDGVTHHEVNDISTVRGFPSFEIFAPMDPADCKFITRYSVLENNGPVYISLNTGEYQSLLPENEKRTVGVPLQFEHGDDITVIALGTAIHDVLEAYTQVKTKGICHADIFAVNSIRPFYPDSLIESLCRTGRVITVEQHSTHGGLGSKVAELIADEGIGAKLFRMGVPEGVFTKNWTAADNKKYFALGAEGIKAKIREAMKL